MERKPFKWIGGHDLGFEVRCECPSPLFENDPSPVLRAITHTFHLSGYADDNFFDNVNKEPRHSKCRCGRPFTYQWFRDGVEFAFDEVKP